MRYFNRARTLSNVLIAIGAFFLVISLGILLAGQVLEQVLMYSNGNMISGAVYFVIFFILSIVSFLLAIVLKCIVKDATEELDSISRSIDRTK